MPKRTRSDAELRDPFMKSSQLLVRYGSPIVSALVSELFWRVLSSVRRSPASGLHLRGQPRCLADVAPRWPRLCTEHGLDFRRFFIALIQIGVHDTEDKSVLSYLGMLDYGPKSVKVHRPVLAEQLWELEPFSEVIPMQIICYCINVFAPHLHQMYHISVARCLPILHHCTDDIERLHGRLLWYSVLII